MLLLWNDWLFVCEQVIGRRLTERRASLAAKQRQMYGRAGFNLLKRRALQAA